jgi:hypothetical protein
VVRDDDQHATLHETGDTCEETKPFRLVFVIMMGLECY